MNVPTIPKRVRVTWIRWNIRLRRDVISHPVWWEITEPDGYSRYFDTKRQATAWANENYPADR